MYRKSLIERICSDTKMLLQLVRHHMKFNDPKGIYGEDLEKKKKGKEVIGHWLQVC